IGAGEPIEIGAVWNFVTTNAKTKAKTEWYLEWNLAIDSMTGGQFSIVTESLRNQDKILIGMTDDGQRVVFDELDPTSPAKAVKSSQNLAFQAYVDSTRYAGLGWLKHIMGEIRVLGAIATAPAWARSSVERVSARE